MRSLIIILWCLPSVLLSQSVIPSNPIEFKVKNAGITVEGSFSDWEVTARFEPKNPQNGHIRGVAKAQSIQTGIKLRDKHLQGRQYFYIDKYPLIEIESKSISGLGADKFTGIFTLRIKDIEREMQIPFQVQNRGQKLIFSAEFEIDRLDFGLGESSLVLSDQVQLFISFEMPVR